MHFNCNTRFYSLILFDGVFHKLIATVTLKTGAQFTHNYDKITCKSYSI